MSFWSDFKAFAVKGNVMDLAVGVIIGGAFGKIVTALVEDMIMPLVGMVGKGESFTDKFFVLKPGKAGETEFKSLAQAKTAGANVLAYGDFIQTIVNFLIIAFSIFIFIQLIANMRKRLDREAAAGAPPPAISSTDKLLMEIRDELKNNKPS
ncbi:MAG: large conductance mechanosensitive channel protein MscL [Flavipsychrobacter sp.]|nr:large conductance mechanosensitive channel protein MscL [Flavipsychrobacter sp.]